MNNLLKHIGERFPEFEIPIPDGLDEAFMGVTDIHNEPKAVYSVENTYGT